MSDFRTGVNGEVVIDPNEILGIEQDTDPSEDGVSVLLWPGRWRIRGRSLAGTGPGAVNVSWGAITGKPDAFPPDTHQHSAGSITDLTEATQDIVGSMVAGAGGTYNDNAGTITLPVSSSWAMSIPPTATAPQATERPNGTYTPPSGRLYFRPFKALQRTYSQIGILVTTAGTGTVRLAIFARLANGSVGELLLDCGSVEPTATGAIWSMISWTPSQPDVYLAVVCQDPGSLQVRCTNSSAPIMSNGVILASSGENVGNHFQDGVTGQIPAVPNPGTYATSGAPTIVIA